MRCPAIGFVTGAALCLASSPTSAQSTTRIETRPFYGATVTIENGVRVFRPLPPHDRVIINPGGRTPLYLGIVENRYSSYSADNYEYSEGGGRGPSAGFVGRLPRGHHHHGRHHHGRHR